MTYEEDLRERLEAEEAYAKGLKDYDLLVTLTKKGTVTVQAHCLEEAQRIAEEFLDEEEIDWVDWETETEEDC